MRIRHKKRNSQIYPQVHRFSQIKPTKTYNKEIKILLLLHFHLQILLLGEYYQKTNKKLHWVNTRKLQFRLATPLPNTATWPFVTSSTSPSTSSHHHCSQPLTLKSHNNPLTQHQSPPHNLQSLCVIANSFYSIITPSLSLPTLNLEDYLGFYEVANFVFLFPPKQ